MSFFYFLGGWIAPVVVKCYVHVDCFRKASELLILLGMQKKGLLASVGMPLALLLMLFSSSFLLLWYDGMLSVLLPLDFDLRTLRSLVVAPITEELCFRSGLISYLLLKGISLPVCIWMSPLLFAVAHVHHVFERVTHKEMPLRSALMAFVLQASYTTIFGWLAAYLFVRSGRVLAPVTAHVFCNWMGLPNFSRMLSHPRRRSLVFCLLMGILGFSVMLKPCTRPELYGYERGESYAGYAIALVENS